MNWATLYRPISLAQIIGQPVAVQQIASWASNKEFPQTIAITGPFGTGKTSLARIIARYNVGNMIDVEEKNAASERGIDEIRKLLDTLNYLPLTGRYRVKILDECFSPDTLIRTPFGQTRIDEIKAADSIINKYGTAKVKRVFKNKVPLNRLMMIFTNNNTPILCSLDHVFFINNGAVYAQLLKPGMELYRYAVPQQNMPIVPTILSAKSTQSNALLQLYASTLHGMWKNIQEKIRRKILFYELCCQSAQSYTTVSTNITQQRVWRKNFTKQKAILCKRIAKIIRHTKQSFATYDFIKSARRYSSKNNIDTSTEWDFKTVNTRRKWQIKQAARAFIKIFSSSNTRVCYFVGKTTTELSNELQSRFSMALYKIGCRNRWAIASCGQNKTIRFKERTQVTRIRVDRIAFYQRSSDEQHFLGYISDKEKQQGFVEFRDLEIDGHPSYFANDIMVHNSHLLTGNAASALLKACEEPPKHIMFILCTSMPEKMPAALFSSGRCVVLNLQLLSTNDIVKILVEIIVKKRMPPIKYKALLEAIAVNSNGVPRVAIAMLQSAVAALDNREPTPDNIKQVMILAHKSVPELSINKAAVQLLRSIYARDLKNVLLLLQLSAGQTPEYLLQRMLSYNQKVMLHNFGDGIDDVALQNIMNRLSITIDDIVLVQNGLLDLYREQKDYLIDGVLLLNARLAQLANRMQHAS